MSKRINAAALAILAVYFGYFAWGALHAHFALDDPTNLGYYWKRGLARVLFDNVRFWSNAYRPMGGLFYLPIYYPFHLNPLPYRIVIMGILAANIAFTWAIARSLTRSNPAAALAAWLVCAHAAMVTIFYNTSMIYDILAFFFTALMLALYLHVRSREVPLTRLQIALVVLAYIAAIDAKEMAVVGAGWVLAYEILVPKSRQWAPPILLMLAGLVYSAGKMLGPGSLSADPGYTLQLTLHRYLLNNAKYWNSLFYSEYFQNSRRLLLAWALLTILCAIYRRREVWWCWFLVSTATLATSFTVVPRDGGALYIPLLAWTLLLAVMIAALIRPEMIQWAVVAVLAILWSQETIHQWRDIAPLYLDQQNATWKVITQIRALPRPAPGSRVMILNSPFDGWDAVFISELLWNDPSLDLRMGDKGVAPDADLLNSCNLIFTFDRTDLRVVRHR